MNNKNLIVIAGLVLLSAVVACSGTINVYKYQYDTTLDEVYLKDGVDFGRYQSVMIDGISVWRPSAHVLSPEDAVTARANLAKAQDLFFSSVGNALSDRYAVVKAAGKNVLRVQVEFIDLRALAPGEDLPADLDRLRVRTKPGHITMIARLLDSRSGEVLARAADLGKREAFGTYTLIDWEAIASDFDYWALVFRGWLDQMHSG
ncbi:MAG: DUF3313 family protein [Xanthomonadales bacterium]|nr:DUF3313 family protein [Xanthomonadales bacterium]